MNLVLKSEVFFVYHTFCRSSTSKADITVAKHVILQHQVKVISYVDEQDKQLLFIRRREIVKDTIIAFAKSNFDVSKMLRVTFIGEASVDNGGPRCEFSSSLLKKC